ncbi:1,4-dihydroxy-2-naphthoate polyprenyltransferase [Propionibacterium australiense]|uniref:1,4-dihydroxy-2-naphthoate octaprenyltransferase n=1 Tax=Propionibacterium australiense TaxID=119981 RepID=A0A383S566_9ACTN|nr:1,4-dihydroxy-2-naphthoate polyprenyltransferase [Propionibacterium australiense]RLP12022.1 1,4-dihydroxy-2-naphthoate polyprenyltransferase [Propionibacterium australiense]RLP12685.1 1,4-dihydroxy-2-naphthoate polyprenyltransferase [Propionibacterium australiense]SYZ32544.1 1,4-dihydroxy-2-naphthoate polyprenyltransferase [Propionibacterium australiense]VEH91705.1 1,4-dihydroxy-2-naphthoate octaprenyltransferase [Propionibacterium australiense]
MASAAEWIEGARMRTLPTAVSPVLAGTAIGWWQGSAPPAVAALCLVVALGLVIGVNFANDYSDGIRGTDDHRVGPQRLVGSGAAEPVTVRNAAFGCFGVAGVAGLAAVALTGHWWLLAVGVACVLAAWFYTGGSHPYGYLGLGEVFVFVFFGLVATAGTVYLLDGRVGSAGWVTAVAMGLIADGVLVTNNLRDIASDTAAGKRTLETRLGERATRLLYAALVVAVTLCGVLVAALSTWWALLCLLGVTLLAPAAHIILGGARGMRLVATLRLTSMGELVFAAGLLAGVAVALALG